MSRDVVVPAGGVIGAAYAEAIGTPYRALAPFGAARVPALQLVVDAVRASGEARRIIVAAPRPVAEAITGVDCWLGSGDSGMENIRRGLAAAAQDQPALVCVSDLPLITPDFVRDFAARCSSEAEISVGLVTQGELETRFPDAPPSVFVPLRDTGPVTLAGLFGVHPGLMQRHEPLFDTLFGARRAQWRMASLLGPRLLWAWMRGELTLSDLTAHAEKRLKCRVEILHGVAPELSYDIDTADDYAYTQTCFGSNPGAASPLV